MSGPVQTLLSRLDGLRETGPNKWAARCPAHDDRSPSLAIKETTGGAVLVHCFAGCDVSEVIGAVGLELSDLFPKTESGKPQRKPWNAADVLRAVTHEVTVIAVCAGQLNKAGLSPEDAARLDLATQRLFAASAEVAA